MKILEINAFCGFGSTGKIVIDIANSLPPTDECYIAYGYFDTSFERSYKIIQNTFSNNFKVKLLCNRIRGTTGYTNGRDTDAFLRWVDSYNPDIIHLHNIHDDYIHIEKLFTYIKEKNIPTVWTFHDCWPFTGRCAYFEYNQCYKWKEGCKDCQFKSVYPISYIRDTSEKQWLKKKQLFNGVGNLTIVTPSDWLRVYVKQSFLSAYDVVTIHNGIDTEIFRYNNNCGYLRQKYNINDKHIILGVANAWGYRKGLDYFFELSKLIDENTIIVLIGLSAGQISKASKISRKILALSHTDSIQELVDWYSLADVYVNPTLEDNYPTTNIEAQACGAPLITFDTGGSPESMKYGEVVEKNINNLFESIKKFIGNKSPNETLSNEFSKYNFASKYYALYKDISNKK